MLLLSYGAWRIAGRNTASHFGQNLAAALAPGGSRSSSRASAGSTVVAGEIEPGSTLASSAALCFRVLIASKYESVVLTVLLLAPMSMCLVTTMWEFLTS